MVTFIVLAILMAAVGYWSRPEAPVPERLIGQPVVSVDVDYAQCQIDNDCTVVDISCDYCSCGTPINKQYKEQYAAERSEKCQGYKGSVCRVACPPEEVKCVDLRCQFVPIVIQ